MIYRWYYMPEKTFRIDGSEVIWRGRAGNFVTHTQWTPYTPKGESPSKWIHHCSKPSLASPRRLALIRAFNDLYLFIVCVCVDPATRTPVSFHVLIDPRMISVADGDQLVVRGSCATLGDWQRNVVMQQHPNEPALWYQ